MTKYRTPDWIDALLYSLAVGFVLALAWAIPFTAQNMLQSTPTATPPYGRLDDAKMGMDNPLHDRAGFRLDAHKGMDAMIGKFGKAADGVVAIEAAIVFSALIIPLLLGSLYVGELAYDKAATVWIAEAVAGSAARTVQAPKGTHSAGEAVAATVFAANRSTLLPAATYSITWQGNLATVTVNASLTSLLGTGISVSSTVSD